MVRLSVHEVVDAVNGKLVRGRKDAFFTGIAIDSRTIRPGDLFIAIVGKRLDGHAFVSEARARGAAGALVSTLNGQDSTDGHVAAVMVEDTTKALQNLAKWHRRRFRCPIIAVTGSNGKTTTKDLTWSILSVKYQTLRSEGSKNNHIGLPLTLLKLDYDTEAAVVELGTSAFGEIRDLVSICSPDIGCITNIGPAHLEFFGNVANVAQAKAELLEGMRDGAPVVLNADDEWFEWLRGRAKGPVVTFGVYRPADFMAEDVRVQNGSVTFRLIADLLGSRRYVRMPFAGAHNVYNALAAAAIASQVGIGTSEVKEGLAKATLPAMSYEISTISGVTVINDAYNANPVSTMSALSSFCEMSISGKRIFVCGDMLELGPYGRQAHRQVGQFIRNQPIDYVIAFGDLAPEVVKAAFGDGLRTEPQRTQRTRSGSAGVPPANCAGRTATEPLCALRAQGGLESAGETPALLRRYACCRSVEEVVSVLKEVAAPGDAVLIKGSRANGMERIVDGLKVVALAPSREDEEK